MQLTKKKVEEKLLRSVARLSAKDAQELLEYAEFLKLREEKWFVDFVNRRGVQAERDKAKGLSFSTIEDLQREYGKR